MDPESPDTPLAAAERVLDRLTGSDAPSRIIREGAALLVRRRDVLARVRVDDGRPLGTVGGDVDGASGAGPARPPSGESSAWRVSRREVAVSRALAEAEVPATRLVDPSDQPWAIGPYIVSAWAWIDPPPTEDSRAAVPLVGPTDLGSLARLLRERGPIGLDGLPTLDPFEAIEAAVGECAADDPEACFVLEHARHLKSRWVEACRRDPLGRSLVHGDLHAENVIVGPDGPLLTDFELSGVGGASYDAAPAAVAVARYGAPPADLDLFINAFGADPRPWDGFATYVAVYEMWTTAWAVGVRAQNPRWAAEAKRRVATLRDGADHQWELN